MTRSWMARLFRWASLVTTALLLPPAGAPAQTNPSPLGPVQTVFTLQGSTPPSDDRAVLSTRSLALDLNLNQAPDSALDDSIGVPSLDRYLDFRRSLKPLGLDVVDRFLATGPLLEGPIFEHWDALSFSPVARDHYYCAPYYERAQSATSIWMVPIVLAVTYVAPLEGNGLFRPVPPP
jgi:hypothetical protein